jgi:ribosomal protein S27AE
MTCPSCGGGMEASVAVPGSHWDEWQCTECGYTEPRS